MYFWRSQLEAHKRELAGLPFDENPPLDVLVPASEAAADFGIGRRTIGRRVVERQADAARAARNEQALTT
jgi:hypothetical protein